MYFSLRVLQPLVAAAATSMSGIHAAICRRCHIDLIGLPPGLKGHLKDAIQRMEAWRLRVSPRGVGLRRPRNTTPRHWESKQTTRHTLPQFLSAREDVTVVPREWSRECAITNEIPQENPSSPKSHVGSQRKRTTATAALPLAMPNLGPHATLLLAEFPTALATFLDTHALHVSSRVRGHTPSHGANRAEKTS